jgi:hypothetical protein
VANNDGVYNAAVDGFVAGVYMARPSDSVGLAGANALAEQAQLFAQAVDSAIAPGTPSQAQLDLVGDLCQSITANKYVKGFPQSAFTATAAGIAVLYNAVEPVLIPIPPPVVGAVANIIYRPGGVAAGNVYTTAATVAAAIAAVNGAARVTVDDSIVSPAPIPNGVTWAGKGALEIVGLPGFSFLNIQDGGQITDIGLPLYNLSLVCDSQTKPAISYTSFADAPLLELVDAEINLSALATIPAIEIPAGANSLVLLVTRSSTLSNSSVGSGIVGIGVGATLFLVCTEIVLNPPIGPALSLATMQGGAGTNLAYIGDGTAFPIPIWSLFTGTTVATTLDNFPFTTTGLPASAITATDISSPFEQGGASATGARSAAFGANSVSNNTSAFSAAFGLAAGVFGAALAGGVADGEFSAGLCNGTGHNNSDFGCGTSASASGTNSAAFAQSTASGSNSFACTGGDATNSFSFAATEGVVFSGSGFGTNGASVSGANSAGIGPITTTFDAEWAMGSDGGPSVVCNVDGNGTVEITGAAAGAGSLGVVFQQNSGAAPNAVMTFGWNTAGAGNLLDFGEENNGASTFIGNTHSPGVGTAGGDTTLQAQGGDGATTNGGNLHLSPGNNGGAGTGANGFLYFDNPTLSPGAVLGMATGFLQVMIQGVGLGQIPYI